MLALPLAAATLAVPERLFQNAVSRSALDEKDRSNRGVDGWLRLGSSERAPQPPASGVRESPAVGHGAGEMRFLPSAEAPAYQRGGFASGTPRDLDDLAAVCRRYELVQLVERGVSLRFAAAACNVALSTAHCWAVHSAGSC